MEEIRMKAIITKQLQHRANWIIGLLVIMVAVLVGCPKPPKIHNEKVNGAGVHGSVFAMVKGEDLDKNNPSGKKIYLPDITIFLKNIRTGEESAPQITNLFGRFMFPKQKPGTYWLLWKAQAGWAAGQFPDSIIIANNTQYPGPVEITAEKGTRVVSGQVKLADGGSPWFYDEFQGINNTAAVTAIDASGNPAAQAVRANIAGEFAIAGIAANVVRLEAKNEAETVDLAIPVNKSLSSANMTFKNQRPQMRGFVAKRHCDPGETITVTARGFEFDGDKLSYKWKNNNGNGTLDPSGENAKWTLPREAGQYSVYVVVSDGRGGYAKDKLTVDVGATEDFFTGRVVDPGNLPVLGAKVSINGIAMSTDSSGSFRLKVKLSKFYVMNITKPGFALFSRKFNQGQSGQTWKLVRTQTASVDPKNKIDLVDRRPELEKKKMKGAQVTIDPNSLVDSAGNLPAGNLNASIATLDIADGEAPGDWGGMENGKEVNLISYGVVYVEFRDGAGKKFNLAPGKTADVTMSIPAVMKEKAADSIPLWTYDEADGLWKLSGTAFRNKATGTYAGKVSHFSTINTDISKTDASCLKVILNSTIPHGLKLRISDVPGGVDFIQVPEFIMNDNVNAVWRLPPNTNVKLELLDINNNVISNLRVEETPGIALPGNIVNSGPPIPPGHTLWPDPNTAEIDDCKAITLSIGIPNWSGFPGSPFLTYKGIGTDALALEYYHGIDPNDLRLTLGDWWGVNGFDANGDAVDAVRTSYLNNNDLGSGRDMHLLQHADGTVSAYVTNYSNGGPFDQNPAFADQALGKINPGATVCMEYSNIEGDADPTHKIVKFFVFAGNGNGALAARQTSADLDGFGPKYVPNLCTNCHGGTYYPAASPGFPTFDEVNMLSSFREFDLTTYKYPGFNNTPNVTEKTLFKQQNLIVKASEPRQTIKDLIDGWYPGASVDQDNSFTPTFWQGAPQQQLYHDVVAASCRTCHIAFVSDAGITGKNWNTYDQFKYYHNTVEDAVCGSYKLMPHALVTYKNFWLSTSPNRPASLRIYSAPGWILFGPCE